MPIETTTNAITRELTAPRAAEIGDAGERGNAMRLGSEVARRLAVQAFALLRDLRLRPRRGKLRSRAGTMTVIVWIAAIAACLYVGMAAMVYFAQRSLMYFPDTISTTPTAAGLPEAEEVPLMASDGVKSIAWHVPPRGDKPVIVYFHGNGGALRYRVQRFRKLITDGIGLVALEYRGYGGLGGSPTEQGLIADGEAAYAYAAAHYQAQQLVLWGESLGSGIAIAIAAEKPVGRVILEAPFTSALDVAERFYWYLPVRLLMKDQFRSDQRIGKVKAPLMIMHGVHDHIVPYALGERLFDLANQPKHIVRFLDGGHEDLDANGALNAVARFLAGDLD